MAATDLFQGFRVLLAEQSKDELIDEILRLRQEKEELQKQLEELKEQIKPAFIKAPVYKPKKRWKKLGRPVGHPGCTLPRNFLSEAVRFHVAY